MAHRDTDHTDMAHKNTDHTDTDREKALISKKSFIAGGIIAFETILSLYMIFHLGKDVYENVKIIQQCRNIWNELLDDTGAEKTE